MTSKNIIRIKDYKSPYGILRLGSFENKLCLCIWMTDKHKEYKSIRLKKLLNAEFEYGTTEILEQATVQLNEFFNKKRKGFNLPYLFSGTCFQLKVWNAILKIPYGKTVSYSSLAQQIGNPKAVRAIANANRANPIVVFVPCHRVIGSNNSMTGYNGGTEIKKQLLDLEKSDSCLI